MKIAVCLFGHLRTYIECYPSLKKHLLDRYDCDVFMHTWSILDNKIKNKESNRTPSFVSGELNKETKEKIINLYNLKDLKIDIQDETKYDSLGFIKINHVHGNSNLSINSLKNLIFTMSSANQLRENYQSQNNIQYDYVVFIRPDILLHEDFEIEKFTEDLSKDELEKSFFLSNSCYPHTRYNDIRKIGASDILFFAKPEVISDIFNNIDKFLNIFYDGFTLIRRTPESFLTETIENLGYSIWQINYLMFLSWDIKRASTKMKNPSTILKYKKHYNSFKNCLKSIFKLPEELIAFLYYFIIRQ